MLIGRRRSLGKVRLIAVELVLSLCAVVLTSVAPATTAGAATNRGNPVANGSWSIESVQGASGVLTDLVCMSATICLATGDRQIIRTTDGGLTWVPAVLPAKFQIVEDPADGYVASLDVESISCPSIFVCFAAANPNLGTGIAILRSNDGGATWQQEPAAIPSDARGFNEISCPTISDCVVVGANVPDPVHAPYSYTGLMMTTTDGGTTWNVPSFPSGLTGIDQVTCPSPTRCLASDSSTLLVSSDGGATWTADASAGTAGVGNITCFTATTCYSTGGTSVSKSADGGQTWTQIADLAFSVYGISCPTPTECVGTASDGSSPGAGTPGFATTVDGGKTWTFSSLPQPAFSQWSIGPIQCQSLVQCMAVGYGSTYGLCPCVNYEGIVLSTTSFVVGVSPAAESQGYWLPWANGKVSPYGTASSFGDATTQALNRPIVGFAPTPDDKGYWEVASDGGIFSYGDAKFYGSMGGTPLNQPIVGLAPTSDGRGYWEVAADGGIFSFGDARFYGSTGSMALNQPVVGMASTEDGRGYCLVAADGGVFTFGDAKFYGSMGGTQLDAPVVGIAATPDGQGYWEVASDGGVFTFGDASFQGSMGGRLLNYPVVGIAATADGQGYWEGAADGGVFTFGNAKFYGSAGTPA